MSLYSNFKMSVLNVCHMCCLDRRILAINNILNFSLQELKKINWENGNSYGNKTTKSQYKNSNIKNYSSLMVQQQVNLSRSPPLCPHLYFYQLSFCTPSVHHIDFVSWSLLSGLPTK